MANFLESLGISGGGTNVYVSVSGANTIEMAIPDGHGTGIKAYGQLPLEYNESLREISNLEDFKDKLLELYNKCNVKPQGSNLYLSLPAVWFGYKENIPLLLDDAAITNVVLGDLEQTYIFKRKDAIPYWFDAVVSPNSDSRSVFYTALQEDIKASIKDIAKQLNINLMSIGSSIFSDLKGLYTVGFAKNFMDDAGLSWSLMIVNNNGYQLFGMQGKKFLEYYEEPLAIKSYDAEEVYSAIDSAAQVALMSSPSSAMVILSETDYVSAEILSKHLQFTGTIVPVEDNKFKKEPLLDSSLLNLIPEEQIKVSLQSAGQIASDNILPVKVNFLEASGEKTSKNDTIEIPIDNGRVIELTPLKATIFSGILLGIIVIPLGLVLLFSSIMSSKATKSIAELDHQIQELDNSLGKYDKKDKEVTFDAVQEIEKVLKNNRVKIMAYSALGDTIPKNLYLTYFMTGNEGFVDIQGCANSVEDVYIFFQNLKDSLIEAKLRLSKLDLKSGSLDNIIDSGNSDYDNAPYVFEITNMNDSQLSSFMQALTGTTPPAGADGKAASDDNKKDNKSTGALDAIKKGIPGMEQSDDPTKQNKE